MATQRLSPRESASTELAGTRKNRTMSLEACLDEERREVLAMLEQDPAARKASTSSTTSKKGKRRNSPPSFMPRSPVRGLLDVDQPGKHRPASMTGESSYLGKPPPTIPVRSMLDITSPVSGNFSKSAHTSPTEPTHQSAMSNGLPPRSLSDASSHPASFGPKAESTIESNYQFSGFLPSNPGVPVAPKRNTQGGGWAKKLVPTAMAEVVRGGDLSTFGTSDRGRHNSLGNPGLSQGKSRSPHNRWSLRSSSPKPDSSKYVLKDGRTLDLNNAYRRLSDIALAQSGSSLSALSGKGRKRSNSGSGPTIVQRLEKDYANGDDAPDDSSDDDSRSSDEGRRGRKKAGRDEEEVKSPVGLGRSPGPRIAQSQMAAADEEAQVVATKEKSKQKVRSMVDPEITLTRPSGERVRTSKSIVHPHTSFDIGSHGPNTPINSDTEAELTDIKRAQKLEIKVTRIDSSENTHRSVRTIHRGDFARMQKEGLENQRRVRKYLVATDLSDEAAHALEWTIGTVLRDGDTLLAIYCVDEEVGIVPTDGSGDDREMREQVAAIAQSTRPGATPIMSPVVTPSPLTHGLRLDAGSGSRSASPMSSRNKAEAERRRAVQDITDRVTDLLRKTKLQVKVVVEVIQCKSPKHLITEVIDYISPTLVILGSRGRSNLKGVILGSFSNYLVTKSSVPVMVARKRLRKHTKFRRTHMRLANNLSSPSVNALTTAIVD